jgi:hypothetical protein
MGGNQTTSIKPMRNLQKKEKHIYKIVEKETAKINIDKNI